MREKNIVVWGMSGIPHGAALHEGSLVIFAAIRRAFPRKGRE
jgi:hypothetical protein